MNKDQKAVVLDAAQEMQSNDEWWEEFEYESGMEWLPCTKYHHPLATVGYNFTFRRKPKTITVTVPVPKNGFYGARWNEVVIPFYSEADRDQALAAIKEAME